MGDLVYLREMRTRPRSSCCGPPESRFVSQLSKYEALVHRYCSSMTGRDLSHDDDLRRC